MPPAQVIMMIASEPVGCSMSPPVPPPSSEGPAEDGGAEAPGDALGSPDAGGEPPGVAQAARTKSTTKRPGKVRFMRAGRRLRPHGSREFCARMAGMHRPAFRWLIPMAVAGPGLGLCLPPMALAHGEAAPAPRWPGALLAWSLDPLAVAGIALAAILYLVAVRRVAAAHPGNPHPAYRS